MSKNIVIGLLVVAFVFTLFYAYIQQVTAVAAQQRTEENRELAIEFERRTLQAEKLYHQASQDLENCRNKSK